MRDASVQDTTTPRHGGDGGGVNHIFRGALNHSYSGNANGLYNRSFSTGTYNSVTGHSYITTHGTPNGIGNSPVNGMAGVNGNDAREQFTRPSEPCLFPGCTTPACQTAPFCTQHLTRISSKAQNAPRQKMVETQPNGSGNLKNGSTTNGAESILTPAESPPNLWTAHDPRKRPRTDYMDNTQQANGNPPQQDRVAESTASGSNSAELASGPSSSSRLGLRLSLLRRIEDRKREKAANGDGAHPSPIAPMTFSLDTYIYNQGSEVAPLPPPPDVVIAPKDKLEAVSAAVSAMLPSTYSSRPSTSSGKPEFVYAHIDPRVHWTRIRPKDWHEAKQKEIAARGGRKANFGKAAQRAAVARRQDAALVADSLTKSIVESTEANEGGSSTRSAKQTRAASKPVDPLPPRQWPSVWKGEMPSDVIHNKEWVSMLSKFAQDEDARKTKRVTKSGSRSKSRQ
ncbi:hypothetical protein SEUCBS140593_006087 [Sporothrix eucalyptigena]|uniref:Uncharacterized protein n=1 Tax=Sporothrix eucalyptigena TaxID=1812306 RepID=A0ABP0C1V9_9PEZI